MISFDRILMATDFSDYSREALDYALHLSSSFNAEMILLHVYEPPFPSSSPGYQEALKLAEQEADQKLQSMADGVRKKNPKVKAVCKQGSPPLQIVMTAKEESVDLIILGTHGRTGIAHFLIGSVAERVVRTAGCPVLTVKPKALVQDIGYW